MDSTNFLFKFKLKITIDGVDHLIKISESDAERLYTKQKLELQKENILDDLRLLQPTTHKIYSEFDIQLSDSLALRIGCGGLVALLKKDEF